jgi:hypothetical protein
MFLSALLLAAQSGVTMSAPHPTKAHHEPVVAMDCKAFRANRDGSWTSIAPTKVGKTSMSAGGTFFPGVRLGEVDVASQLTKQCGRG